MGNTDLLRPLTAAELARVVHTEGSVRILHATQPGGPLVVVRLGRDGTTVLERELCSRFRTAFRMVNAMRIRAWAAGTEDQPAPYTEEDDR